MMKYANALLARLGYSAKAGPKADAFDLRLARIERREAMYAARKSLFRNQQTLRAA